MAIRDETRMLLESMSRLFEDHCTKQVVDAAETGVFARTLWDAVAETGVPLAALPEVSRGAPMPSGPICTPRCGSRAGMPRPFLWRKPCSPGGPPPRAVWKRATVR